MYRVLGKLSNASLARAHSRWREAASRDSRLRTKVERVLFRLRWRVCAAGMNTWAVVTKMRLRGRMVVRRIHQCQAQKAVQTWCTAASEISRNRRVLSKTLHRMLKRLLLMAWNMFVNTVRETQHTRETVRRVLLRISHRVLVEGFDRWVEQATEESRVKAIQENERLCKRLLKHWTRPFGVIERRLYLINSFRTWVLSVDSQHTNAYVDHIVTCLLIRFARARRSRSLFTTLEVFKHGIARAYGKSYIKNLVFSQLNRHARNLKRCHFQAWSSVLFTISTAAIPPAIEFVDTMAMDY